MTRIDSSGQTGPITPRDRKMYEEEYKHGADLFQRALAEHAKTKDIYKREEFKEVMDKALLVLNETARELKAKDLLKQNQIIEKDYQVYQAHPDPSTQEKLNRDLDDARTRF